MIATPTRAGACPVTCKLAAIAVAMLACNVPVHVTQSPHILPYSQWFVLCADQKTLRRDLINELFNIPPEDAPYAKDVEEIAIRGSVYFRILSVPVDPSAFTIDGHGWHRMYYGATRDSDDSMYLASADYRIVNDGPIYLSELRRTSLIMKVKIWNKTYSSFMRPSPDTSRRMLATVQGEGFIFIKLFLRTIAEDVYTIDFDRKHIVGVGPPISSDGRRRIQPIGYMRFVPPGDERNLWDFRRKMPVTTDYASMMITRIGNRHETLDSAAAEWLPEPSCQDLHQGSR